MRVAIVGCGGQGTGLGGLLAMEPDVEELVLADQDSNVVSMARHFIESLGSRSRVRSIVEAKVDAGNSAELARVISGADLVFNGTIPKFNLPIMRACLAARAHYLDLFGLPFEGPGVDPAETVGAQFALDGAFKASDIIAVPSVGMSPGWTSLAVEHMVKGMDSLHEVIIRWADWVDTDVMIAPISPIVIFHEWFGPPHPVAMVDGRVEAVDLIDSAETFQFPSPVGDREVFTVTAHADLALINRFLGRPIRRIEEKGGIVLGRLNMQQVWLKAISMQTPKHAGIENFDMMKTFADSFISPIRFKEYVDRGLIRDAALSFSVEGRGVVNGERIHHTCYYTSTLETATSHLPWASHAVYGTVAGVPVELVLRICRGEVEARGVVNLPDLGISTELMRATASRGQALSEKIVRAI
ncbi:MAG: saccharopine dehydrogenase NADP-binding domain-containing protein [Steroidobacteraceae bacterium]